MCVTGDPLLGLCQLQACWRPSFIRELLSSAEAYGVHSLAMILSLGRVGSFRGDAQLYILGISFQALVGTTAQRLEGEQGETSPNLITRSIGESDTL